MLRRCTIMAIACAALACGKETRPLNNTPKDTGTTTGDPDSGTEADSGTPDSGTTTGNDDVQTIDLGTLMTGANGEVDASFELPDDFELEVNLGAAAIGQTRPNGYLAQGIAAASLSRELTSSLLGFFEVLFNTRDERGGREQLAINAGLVHRVTSRLAIDAGVQTSLVGQGPDVVVRTGVTVLWR